MNLQRAQVVGKYSTGNSASRRTSWPTRTDWGTLKLGRQFSRVGREHGTIQATGLEWQAWLGAALPAALVTYALVLKRVDRLGGGLLVATYGVYLGFTFR